MIDSEQDVKWECLNDNCGHVWYDQYEFEYVQCPKCKSENIKENV